MSFSLAAAIIVFLMIQIYTEYILPQTIEDVSKKPQNPSKWSSTYSFVGVSKYINPMKC